MTISANYQQPVVVNGYPCWNCHQVSEAKQGVNPATQGPFGVQAASATVSATPGGAASPTTATSGRVGATSAGGYAAGAVLDVSV